ncbi:hypothetical protein MHI24_21650 [Paenibacillus sp. FSL K6-1096]|uniref:hypothetical protein n=1 Tax=Paenibacillus sp. FSL K6-1096 TaxID=2921460 RepID=UPI0030EEC9F3
MDKHREQLLKLVPCAHDIFQVPGSVECCSLLNDFCSTRMSVYFKLPANREQWRMEPQVPAVIT